MRFRKFKEVMFAILILALPIWGQAGDSADKEMIKEMIGKCANALQSQDWASLEGMISSDWVHLTDQATRWDFATTKGFFTDHISDHSIRFTDTDVHVSKDASMAWATFNEKTEYKFDGNPVKQQALFTAIFEKEGGAWKMQILHRSVAPPPEQK